ncbi:hypothetical protein KK062_02455 [Fulvivirgaceae bacterium PWU5]|uniref:Uncharacterized protein n=1 Tax=Dawidia cretensis TaxID=2782350 RepID=A0AAP2DTD6_9BACT|nr:hypothetical protein [Dawidia cretensis]MBT1707063.1 hypothetical protein [Dawidia cretensis]
MKKAWKLSWSLIILLAAAVAFTACSDDDDEDGSNEPTALEPADGETLIGEVKSGETLTLKADRSFTIDKALRVRDGGTLKIEAGVTVTASEDGSSNAMFIVIEQGAKIDAQGTDAKPIVLTAEAEQPGSWGGLLVCGRAPINVGTTAITEIGDASYGGTAAADNSGTIKYLRTEYSGSKINAEKEHNGITLYGVGSGTVIDHIEAYKGADDGIEMFGGTVNLSYVFCYGSQDDQFDWAQGWSGTIQYLYTEQMNDVNYLQDKGIEADNLDVNNAATPFSNPTVKNVTIMGYEVVKNGDGETVDGIRIREGSKGTFDNIVIKGYSDDAIDARSLVTLQNLGDNSLKFTNVYSDVADKNYDVKLDDGETDPGSAVDTAKGKLEAALVANEPTGANFDSWKGTWTKK